MAESIGTNGLCKHWVERKKRHCKFQVKAGQEYCAEHSIKVKSDASGEVEDERIPCPFDGAHSVFKSKLAQHMKKCNARPVDASQRPYYKEAVNSGTIEDEKGSEGMVKESCVASLVTDRFATILPKDIIDMYPEHINTRDCVTAESDDEDEEVDETSPIQKVSNSQKHSLQHTALYAEIEPVLEDAKRHGDEVIVIEFGAGKAGLSSYIYERMMQSEMAEKGCSISNESCEDNPVTDSITSNINSTNTIPTTNTTIVKFILIDRSNSRSKKDAKMKHLGVQVQRLQMDICDFDLNAMISAHRPADPSKKLRILAVSKHLCGAATCLTVNALKGVDEFDFLRGVSFCLAVCCHQACQWQHFPNKEGLRGLLDNDDDCIHRFNVLKGISSWAVCNLGEDVLEEGNDSDSIQFSSRKRMKVELLPRRKVGWLSKRLLDHLRLQSLQLKYPTAKLKPYCDAKITLENFILTKQ